jgi:hypothetical protein
VWQPRSVASFSCAISWCISLGCSTQDAHGPRA